MARWAADKNIEFINEYEQHMCLWNPKHPLYKNRDAREAAYRNIMEVMQLETVKDVITKIRTLRNTYNSEVLKSKKSNNKYVSKIPWLPYLDFLKNIEREDSKNLTLDFSQDEIATDPIKTEYILCAPNTNKRKKPAELVDTPAVHSNADEFDLFGQTIAEQLRQLPLEYALETEEVILATIRKRRVKVATKMQPRRSSSESSP